MSRVILGLFMVAAWCFLLFLGSQQLFALLMLCVAGIGLFEYFRMLYPDKRDFAVLLVPCLFPMILAIYGQAEMVLAGLVLSLLALVFLTMLRYENLGNASHFLGLAVFATVYVSVCMSHWVLIRFLPHGEYWLLMLTAIVAGSDTGAYYMGRALGKRKLCPSISPKKTVAGGVGGLLAGALAAQLINLLLPQSANPLMLLLVSLVLVVIGMFGDLTESILKRSCGVKDSGTILLGHGGVLDRVDSLLLSGPILYYFLKLGILP